MKILKFLFGTLLILIVLALGGVIFSNKIITHMTKTEKSEFEGVSFSFEKGSFTFKNFILNDKNLGKGEAKVRISKNKKLDIIPRIEIETLKLEDVDLDEIYKSNNEKVDTFISKLEIPVVDENFENTTDNFLKKTIEEINTINLNISDFKNNKIGSNLNTINKIKTEYSSLKDLKSKAQKLEELNKELTPLLKSINDKKIEAENEISKIETERNITLENVSKQLLKLEKLVKLNDIKNIGSYTFIDKGKIITDVMNKSMKSLDLVNSIKNISKYSISNLDINNGEIKFENLQNINNLSGEINLDNNKINVKNIDKSYQVDYAKDNLKINILYSDNIILNIEYTKNDLLDGKMIKIVSEIKQNKENIEITDKTILTEDEKIELINKNNNLETNGYNEIIDKYETQITEVENLILGVYQKIFDLDNLKMQALSINKIIDLSGFSINDIKSNNSIEENLQKSDSPKVENNSETNKKNEPNNKENQNKNFGNDIKNIFKK